jgi:uncharacterized protein YecE (DUF72 family)
MLESILREPTSNMATPPAIGDSRKLESHLRDDWSEPIRPGVCGFCLPQSELFRRFKLLEVQQTFYWPPQLKTVERWRRTAPEDFEFTVKAFQAITHGPTSPTYRRTKFTNDERSQCGGFCDTPVVRNAWKTTLALATALEAPVVVFQCPPSFDASESNVRQFRRFFEWAERGRLRFAWEPRHETWTMELVRELCAWLDLIHVVDPLEQPDVHSFAGGSVAAATSTPATPNVYGRPRYLRLHGKALGRFRYDYNGAYTDDELADIKRRCEPGPSYCLFNNKQMAVDTPRFIELLQRDAGRTPPTVKPK